MEHFIAAEMMKGERGAIDDARSTRLNYKVQSSHKAALLHATSLSLHVY